MGRVNLFSFLCDCVPKHIFCLCIRQLYEAGVDVNLIVNNSASHPSHVVDSNPPAILPDPLSIFSKCSLQTRAATLLNFVGMISLCYATKDMPVCMMYV